MYETLCVYVCVCERENETVYLCVYWPVCVYLCVRESVSEREREGEIVGACVCIILCISTFLCTAL